MEQTFEARFAQGEVIPVTLLGENSATVDARVVNRSFSGLGVELPLEVVPGTAVKIQLTDDILLGEVVHCRQQGDQFFLGIHLDQTLRGLSELGRIVRAFEEGSETQTSDPIHQRR